MGAIQRQSRLAPNPETTDHTFESADSPIVISHASFVGLGIIIEEGSGADNLVVSVDGVADGDFVDEVTMEGVGNWRWPDVNGMNRLYNARYIKIEWDAGFIQVFQKG